MAPFRILVVDDSAFMRKIFSDLITNDPQFTIVATADNGAEAVEAVNKWKPDAVTLDLEMPVMNGLEALEQIMRLNPVPVIMLSGISEDNTRDTIKALQYGAFDFIRKPSSAISRDIHQVGDQLIEKLKIAVLTKRPQPLTQIQEFETKPIQPIQPIKTDIFTEIVQPQKFEDTSSKPTAPNSADRKKPSLQPTKDKKPPQATAPLHTQWSQPLPSKLSLEGKDRMKSAPDKSSLKEKAELKTQAAKAVLPTEAIMRKPAAAAGSFRHIVAIGTSTGGPRALHEVISSLPEGFPSPVLVVQHMPPKFTKSLAQRLDSFSELRVVEATNGEQVAAGVVYIAPGGYHMELSKDKTGYCIRLTEQPQRNGHRPSVDVLFESLIPYPELKRHAVIMTGMGSDGAKGMKQLVESGACSAIAEAEETCIVYGMPRSAIEAGTARTVLPLQHIASELVHAVLK